MCNNVLILYCETLHGLTWMQDCLDKVNSFSKKICTVSAGKPITYLKLVYEKVKLNADEPLRENGKSCDN